MTRTALLLALLVTAVVSTASAERVYQPLGAPADAKVSVRWNFYRDYAEATGLLKQIAAAHPKICRLESLGTSYGGREMWVLTITNQANGETKDELNKPAFWVDGGIHANEVQSVDVVLYTAWYLTEMYGRSDFVTQLVDDRVIYLMPMMSPDSRDAHMHEPNTTHQPRGGQRPVDDDRDGLTDEDPADDLDGDGHITQMRVRDPLGTHKQHDKYPGMMVRVGPGEVGTHRMLGAEGIDNDGDGAVNEDGDGYYDPNRDWPWQWQPGYVQRGAHHYPLSIAENRMVADFIMARPHIAGAQSYHNTGGMILRGPGSKSDRWPRSDIAVYDRLAAPGLRMLPGYKYINTGEELYEVWGGEHDWLYAMVGAYTFTNELNTPFNLFREAADNGGFFASEEKQREFDKYLLMGDGFVAWHEVKHPQYGKVEVGGVKKSWGRQPPSFLLEEECHRNMAFSLWHADQIPQVEIESLAVKQLGSDLFEVTAVVINRKITPTRSAFNVSKKLTPPDRVSIAGHDITVVAALTASTPFELSTPRDSSDVQRQPESVSVPTIGSWRPLYVRWIVTGAGPYDVEVRSTKGGTAKQTISDSSKS